MYPYAWHSSNRILVTSFVQLSLKSQTFSTHFYHFLNSSRILFGIPVPTPIIRGHFLLALSQGLYQAGTFFNPYLYVGNVCMQITRPGWLVNGRTGSCASYSGIAMRGHHTKRFRVKQNDVSFLLWLLIQPNYLTNQWISWLFADILLTYKIRWEPKEFTEHC